MEGAGSFTSLPPFLAVPRSPSPPDTPAQVRANGGQAWRPGDAFLNSYDGAYRGVGLVVHRGAGDDEGSSQLDQYAYLPLDLF